MTEGSGAARRHSVKLLTFVKMFTQSFDWSKPGAKKAWWFALMVNKMN
jgi:hypothetical protein